VVRTSTERKSATPTVEKKKADKSAGSTIAVQLCISDWYFDGERFHEGCLVLPLLEANTSEEVIEN
jgi:hypothetical protein